MELKLDVKKLRNSFFQWFVISVIMLSIFSILHKFLDETVNFSYEMWCVYWFNLIIYSYLLFSNNSREEV